MTRTILLPVDLNITDGNREVLDAALRLLDDGGTLHVVSVLPDYGLPMVSDQFDRRRESRAHQAVREALDQWIAANVPKGIATRAHMLTGTVYDQILRAANRLQVDLIVIGAHRPELSDYLLGSNAARVVRHATQSVYVVRHANGAGKAAG